MNWADVGIRALWKRSEAIGFAPTVLCVIAWFGCGAAGARAGALALWEYPRLAEVFVWVVATVEGICGLVAFWIIAGHVDYWRRGYRLRWLTGNEYVYEERRADGSVQYLRLSILADGYPAPCEVSIPSEARWEQQAPQWAQQRRAEIVERIAQLCDGRVQFKDPT